jgi:hypothetical protein
MDNQAHIAPGAPVAATDQPLVHEHGVRAAFGYFSHGFFGISQAGDGADRDPVIQRHDDAALCFPINDAF